MYFQAYWSELMNRCPNFSVQAQFLIFIAVFLTTLLNTINLHFYIMDAKKQ